MPETIAKVVKYADRIPPEVRRAIDGLSSENRQAIVVALSEKGRLGFSALQSELGLSKSDLAFHLNRLVQAGLVLHVYERFPSNESHAYYRLSELGEGLLKGIENAFSPPAPPSPLAPNILMLRYVPKAELSIHSYQIKIKQRPPIREFRGFEYEYLPLAQRWSEHIHPTISRFVEEIEGV